MKESIKNKLAESLVFELLDQMMGEDYPSSFNMDEFKSLTSFAARIRYCEQHLQRISSGSSRIVYKIDDEKVLKLAKNKKGLAQNEVEIEWSQYHDISDITARVFDSHPDNLWVEMELARKLKKSEFKKMTGFNWDDYAIAMHNEYWNNVNYNPRMLRPINKEMVEAMWEEEFIYEMFNFITSYQVPAGDLMRTSSYGLVKRDGREDIVLIDYGLTSDVYDSYYS